MTRQLVNLQINEPQILHTIQMYDNNNSANGLHLIQLFFFLHFMSNIQYRILSMQAIFKNSNIKLIKKQNRKIASKNPLNHKQFI